MRGSSRRLVLAIAATLAAPGCNAVLGPSPRDANWHVVESAHFALHVRPGSFAERSAGTLGTVLDDQYVVTLRLLEGQYDGEVNGFLYDSADDAKLQGDRSGTAFADTNAFEAVASPPLDSNLLSLVAHEANHVIIINALGRAGTSLLNEGLPSAVLSERYHWLGKHYYYAWTKTHRAEIPAMARLANDDEWPKLDQHVAYSAGASFLAYLLDTYGAAKLRQLFYARSSGFADRFAEIYGRPLTAVEGEWLAFCDAY